MAKLDMRLLLFVTVLFAVLDVCTSYAVEYEIDESGRGIGSGSGSGSGSGEQPTTIICDDEDLECDPSVRVTIKSTSQPTTTTHNTHNKQTITHPTTTTHNKQTITHPTTTTHNNQNKQTTTPTITSTTINNVETMATTTSSVPMFTIGQPRFHGNSFMVMPRLPSSARRSLEVSITFKPERKDGLLLYAGRKSREKDFIAIGLVDGYVELSFSNGADTVTIKTPNNVTLGKWHQVVVFRDQRDGYVTLDYSQMVSGSSKKNQNQMNLNTPLYLGGLPRYSVNNIPYVHGLSGCVKKVVVDGKKLDLRLPGGEVKRSHNIDECQQSTQKCQCKNGGVCRFTNQGQSMCACPLGTAGQYCQNEITLKLPSFNGHSYLSYPSTGDVASKSFTISLTLKPASETGLLLLNTDRDKGQGDFFSLSLREGMVEFLFDCGSGAAIIRSKEPISTEYWHIITIWRSGRKGSLKIDDGLPVFGESPGRLRHISLRQSLYVGGMKDYKYQPFAIEMKTGFVGSIQKVIINSVPLDLSSPISGLNIDNCNHVCVKQPVCQNGGTCHAERNGFKCQCQIGYTGMLCDKRLDIKMPSFPGRSYLSYPASGHQAYYSDFTISIVLKPRKDTGLILYNGQHIDGSRGDYVSLALRKGFVEFTFDCGSGAAVLRSTTKILVEQWHTITISRRYKIGKLILDGGKPVLGKSPGYFSTITLKDDLYLGGMKDYSLQPLASAVKTGFVGCIQKVTINSKPLDLSSPRSGVNVHNCDHACVTHYVCMNGGTCHAEMDSFRCQCTKGYTGMMCDRVVKVNSHHFDGNSFVAITKKRILKRISGPTIDVRLQIKTALDKGILLLVHQPKSLHKTYLIVLLNHGVIEVRNKIENKEETIIKSNHRVNDDKWHTIHITRTSSIWNIQVDDYKKDKEQYKEQFTFHRGEMFIGGTPDHMTDWPNYKGSIKGLVIGGYKVDVIEDSVTDVGARRYRMPAI